MSPCVADQDRDSLLLVLMRRRAAVDLLDLPVQLGAVSCHVHPDRLRGLAHEPGHLVGIPPAGGGDHDLSTAAQLHLHHQSMHSDQ